MKNTTDNLKSYHLSTDEIESLLRNKYGSSIQPVDYAALQQLRRKQELQAAMRLSYTSRHSKGVQTEPVAEMDVLVAELAMNE